MADRRVRVVYEFRTKHQHAEVRCGGCGRVVIYPPALAIATFGPGTGLSQLEKRLRCQQCGAKRATIRGVWREYHG